MIYRRNQISGLTLLETSIVVIVVSIIVSLAYIQLVKTTESAYGKEARIALSTVLAAEKMLFARTGAYVECLSTAECNSDLNLNLDGTHWNYKVYSDGISSLLCKAYRRSGRYAAAGAYIWIHSDGSFTTHNWLF